MAVKWTRDGRTDRGVVRRTFSWQLGWDGVTLAWRLDRMTGTADQSALHVKKILAWRTVREALEGMTLQAHQASVHHNL